MREAEPKKLREAGEPCALKGACTVRRGEVRKGLSEIPLESDFWQVEDTNGTSLVPYPTLFVKKTLIGQNCDGFVRGTPPHVTPL
jgi:hypothetical protein